MINLTKERLAEIEARCEAATDECESENCAVDRLCCTCINAPWQLTNLYGMIAEVKRLREKLGPCSCGELINHDYCTTCLGDWES